MSTNCQAGEQIKRQMDWQMDMYIEERKKCNSECECEKCDKRNLTNKSSLWKVKIEFELKY